MLLSGQRIDSTFGVNGFWQMTEDDHDLQSPAYGEVEVLPDGKLLVANIHDRGLEVQTRLSEFHSSNFCQGMSLWVKRLMPDGSPDSSFGKDGIVFYPLPFYGLSYSAKNTSFYDLILKPTGGFFTLFQGGKNLLNVYAFQPNGSLDSTFGDNGVVAFHSEKEGIPGGNVNSGKLTILAQGDLLHGGSTREGIFFTQLNKSGQIETQFGDNGIKYIANYGNFILKLNADTCIYVLTKTTSLTRGSSLTKLHLHGQVDTTFKDEGRYNKPRVRFYDLTVLPDGKILILHNEGIEVLQPSGDLYKQIEFSSFQHWPLSFIRLTRIFLTKANKLLLGGYSGYEYMVARLMPDFQPDTTYGFAGFRKERHQGKNVQEVRRASITEDESLIMMSEWGLAKFDSTGNYAASFGNQGTLPVYNPFLSGYWKGIEIDSLGDIWAWGNGGEDNENFFIAHVGRNAGRPMSKGFQGLIWLNPAPGTDRVGHSRDVFNQLTGWKWTSDSTFLLTGRENADGFLRRYHVSGKPDTTYSQVKIDELVTHIIDGPDQEIYVRAVDIYPDPEFYGSSLVRRIHVDGTIDPSFSSGECGWNVPSMDIISVENDKRLFIYGSENGLLDNDYREDFFIHRRFKNGLLDVDFGWKRYSIPQEFPFLPLGAQQLPNQSIRLIGIEGMVNITEKGEIDRTAYEKKWRPIDLGFSPNSVAIYNPQLIFEPDSGFLLFGNAYFGEYRYNIFLARFTKDGYPDINFGDSGLYVLQRPYHSDLVHSVFRESDSVYVLAGSSNAQMMMTRLHVPPTKKQGIIPMPLDTTVIQGIIPMPPDTTVIVNTTLIFDSTNYTQTTIYPNPTSSNSLKIQFKLEVDSKADISLYSIEGHLIERLLSKQYQKGSHEASLTLPANLHPGHYLFRLQTSQSDSWHKIVFIP
jgi:uncharacterized delta-60 repeat protein